MAPPVQKAPYRDNSATEMSTLGRALVSSVSFGLGVRGHLPLLPIVDEWYTTDYPASEVNRLEGGLPMLRPASGIPRFPNRNIVASTGGLSVSTGASVRLGGEGFSVSRDEPLVFGRADDEAVVGLDPTDMGISAIAGSVEWAWGTWWVVNRSGKRRLLLDDGGGGAPQRLECGQRFAISVPRLNVLVPGAIRTHRLEVVVPEDQLARFEGERPSSGTVTASAVRLSDKDKDVLVALFSRYLEDFPRRSARPLTYQEAADLLGPPWTKVTVRKQIERLKERMGKADLYFEGPHALYDLADHLVANGLLSPADLGRLRGPRS
jgi:hypothetical protein